MVLTLKEKELSSYSLQVWACRLITGSSSFHLFSFYYSYKKSIVYTYYNHSTSEFPELCVDSNCKGGLNKIICTSAVRSRNSRTRMKTCWNEFIAICLYFAYQLNQTPQIFSNMRKIFKLFVLCPFSTCNSSCHFLIRIEWPSIAVNSFLHSLWDISAQLQIYIILIIQKYTY